MIQLTKKTPTHEAAEGRHTSIDNQNGYGHVNSENRFRAPPRGSSNVDNR